MNKDLAKIASMAEAIETETNTKQSYLDAIAKAEAAQARAHEAKEHAETEDDFDLACDAETHAKEKVAFFKRKLDEHDFTPRMNEADYYKAVDMANNVMEKAAANYQKIMNKCIAELVEAKDVYMQTARDADRVLEVLDKKANVLQSKYRYREQTYLNAPSKFTEDRGYWREKATRFLQGKAYGLAVHNPRQASCYTLPDREGD